MEIDLERAKRALMELGTALEEARQVVSPGTPGHLRVKTENRVIELPMSWALGGLAAFALATLLARVPTPITRKLREEEPLGIG